VPKLRRCFDYGEVELSNNLAENSNAPGNAGPQETGCTSASAKAGPKVAAIIFDRRILPQVGCAGKDYMLDVLPGMDRRKLSEMAKLTPSRWSAART